MKKLTEIPKNIIKRYIITCDKKECQIFYNKFYTRIFKPFSITEDEEWVMLENKYMKISFDKIKTGNLVVTVYQNN